MRRLALISFGHAALSGSFGFIVSLFCRSSVFGKTHGHHLLTGFVGLFLTLTLQLPQAAAAASCRASFDRDFFGLAESATVSIGGEDGTSQNNRHWDSADKILKGIKTASRVTPSNYEKLFSVVAGPMGNKTQVVWQSVPAVGLCLHLPLLDADPGATPPRKLLWHLTVYQTEFMSLGPHAAVMGLSQNRASVRYPSRNAYFSPTCASQIESDKRFVIEDMMANPHLFGFNPNSASYYSIRADRSWNARRIYLTADREHLLSLRWVDDVRGEQEKLFEVCAFPLILPSVK